VSISHQICLRMLEALAGPRSNEQLRLQIMASSSRLDGRAAIELRPLSASFGELDRADGSARFSFGELPFRSHSLS